MYDGFSVTNLKLDFGAYSVPKNTLDFKATSTFDVSAYKLGDLKLTETYDFSVDYSGVFSSSKPATPVPSERPYIWKYQ